MQEIYITRNITYQKQQPNNMGSDWKPVGSIRFSDSIVNWKDAYEGLSWTGRVCNCSYLL